MAGSRFNTTGTLLVRALLIVVALAAPVLALPRLDGPQAGTIEAPALKKQGAGFVLMISLQRA